MAMVTIFNLDQHAIESRMRLHHSIHRRKNGLIFNTPFINGLNQPMAVSLLKALRGLFDENGFGG